MGIGLSGDRNDLGDHNRWDRKNVYFCIYDVSLDPNVIEIASR